MDKVITALHAAGVAAPLLAALAFILVLAIYGPKWIATISGCVLQHRRFDLEREMSRETVKIARENRIEPELLPAPPASSASPATAAALPAPEKAANPEGSEAPEGA